MNGAAPTPRDPHDAHQIDMFLSGACASYAIALARRLSPEGDPVVEVMFDDDGEPNTADDRCAVHAFWSGDQTADAGGVRTPETMADDYGFDSWSLDGPYSVAEFQRFFCGEDGPFDLDEADIAAAGDLIERNPDLLPRP